MFAPAITYVVPEAGWIDEEDLQGNVLLLPPGNTLPDVNAGTSDFIGVYASIAPARFTALPSCATESVVEVADTPNAFAAWLGRQKDVSATSPVPVSVGGLRGLRIDLSVKPRAALARCTDDESGDPVRYRPILTGEGASSLDHGLIADLTMRLHLLAWKQGVLAIEVDDVEKAPGTLTSPSAVAETLRFADPGSGNG
ncbi:hypothetical protein [Amnibacterium sp.]|uniref:hypothetical protein n=1 Tax=Amnibacterium sp. TaxID=1872496 RepID=UPI0026160B5B|nr:hypothetical protein [Amnibacterium sp.]